MRLNPDELQAIRRTLLGADPAGQIRLFGSRADDNRRGGDIDLYFEPSRPIDAKTALLLQYQLTYRCDTQVDLLIRNPGQPIQPIHQIAAAGIAL